jgi:PPM family protein phosphatase
MRRSGNEDTFGVFDIPGYEAAFVVCDGMGGLQAGDIAANEAVRVIGIELKAQLASPSADPATVLLSALRRANDAVNALARPGTASEDDPTQSSEPAPSNALMGTTVVAGLVRNETLWIAHAGDSRGYRLRSGVLERLTLDHSFVAEQVRAGNMTEAEARISRFRNMITRAIGIDPSLQPEVRKEPLREGDTILVCSDGLTTMLDDEEIEPLLQAPGSLERRVQSLIDAANRKGGHDNITVLLVGAGESQGEPVRKPVEQRGGGVPAPEGSRSRRRRSSGPSPIVRLMAVFGGLAFLGLFVLALSSPLRARLATSLASSPPDAAPERILDFARLAYDPVPKRIVDTPLARRNQLALQPDGGAVFVRNSGGQVVQVRPDHAEKVLIGDIKVPDNEKMDTDSLDNEVYLASDPQGNLYISQSARGVIKKLSPDGKELRRVAGLYRPGALCVDPKTGDIYFIDATNHVLALRAIHNAPTSPAPK